MSHPETLRTSRPLMAFGVYGASGFGREVMPLLHACLRARAAENPSTEYAPYFIDDHVTETECNGYPILSSEAFFSLAAQETYVNIAIANSQIRQKLADACLARGAKPFAIHSPHAVMYDANILGEGSILCAHTVITSNATIGKFFHANLGSYVAHDCVIGDYVTFAPHVRCNGNVHIADHAYIGTGAILKQGTPEKPLRIGEGAVVGMGAVVTKDVPPHTTVVGNPAKPFVKG